MIDEMLQSVRMHMPRCLLRPMVGCNLMPIRSLAAVARLLLQAVGHHDELMLSATTADAPHVARLRVAGCTQRSAPTAAHVVSTGSSSSDDMESVGPPPPEPPPLPPPSPLMLVGATPLLAGAALLPGRAAPLLLPSARCTRHLGQELSTGITKQR